ncbi:hypothetical protein Rs2_47353 [Raphanus sativus]|nr:hypothetical protein Rs2_47353 [Raphanus sativus]
MADQPKMSPTPKTRKKATAPSLSCPCRLLFPPNPRSFESCLSGQSCFRVKRQEGDLVVQQRRRVSDKDAEYFSDIIVHKGQIYALDVNGAIWWISLSELKIFQYGPSTPIDYYEYDDCKDKRLIEYCGELCIIHRFRKKFRVRRVDVERTVGLRLLRWIWSWLNGLRLSLWEIMLLSWRRIVV